MLLAIIILIFALALLAVGVNAIQQHKQRVELERRQKIHRYRNILEETEDLMTIASDFPVGKALMHVLRCRARDSLKLLIDVQPNVAELKARLEEYEEAIAGYNPNDKSLLVENFSIPAHDKQIVVMLQGLKKLRKMLRSEHGRNRVDSNIFHEEDRRIEKALIRISAESLIRRGEAAFSTGMIGSARQYLEKAKRTLDEVTFSDDYITKKLAYIDQKLKEIMETLRVANAKDAAKRDEKSDIDELFQPKKKW
ncbi:hypothetical protein CWE15_07060 [Aliidiomarina taiwanensis]|uniref:DNA repair protein n=1 Tax=Aliidiomarina taiwanensis TaxID=946228 RepID=A0A432X1T8_9GAMM|nr:hypothetical protein [Aliidiomarina taiwanensis]RUO40509.1 hypothetical protein CWE15_07060 [Aliidiomarina taiwanensis]